MGPPPGLLVLLNQEGEEQGGVSLPAGVTDRSVAPKAAFKSSGAEDVKVQIPRSRLYRVSISIPGPAICIFISLPKVILNQS